MLATGLSLALTAAPVLAQSAGQTPMITVTGSGEVSVAPDVAWIDVGVTADAKDPQEASAQMSASAEKVIAQLVEAGIPRRDIQTSQLRLSPRRVMNTQKAYEVVGFTATTRVEAKISDIDSLGAVLGALVKEGANLIDGLRFGLEDRGEAMNQARRDAIQDAMSKAELYAEAAGAKLGKLTSITDGGSSAPMPMQGRTMAMSAPAEIPVEAGEITLNAQVAMSWKLGS